VAVPAPEPGLVVAYSYLWEAEYRRGREEGVKDRPCVIVISVLDVSGKQIVTVAPVTHSQPSAQDDAVEIPAKTKERLGLDSSRSWVIVSEVNDFVWPGPDLRPLADKRRGFQYGFLPPTLFLQIRDRIRANGRTGNLASVPRTE